MDVDVTDEILPEDDSVFEAVVDDTFNISSDAMLEDSFSSFPAAARLARLAPVTSTPTVQRTRSRTRTGSTVQDDLAGSPARRTRSRTRAESPLPGPSRLSVQDDLAASPARSTRSRTRAESPLPGPSRLSVQDNLAASPARSTRSRTRAESPLPGPSNVPVQDDLAASPSRSTRSRTGALTPTQGKPARIKCRECPATLANARTMAVHKKGHSMKRAFSKAASKEEFLEKMPNLLTNTFKALMEEPLVGKWSQEIKSFSEALADSLSDLQEEHEDLFQFLHAHFYRILTNHCSIFSSSLCYALYVGVNALLNNGEFRDDLKRHIVAIPLIIDTPSMEIINLFMGHLMLILSKEVLLFFIRTIHGATANDVIMRKRSGDDCDSQTFLELCYHIGGSVVNGCLFKGKKYKERNPSWALFLSVLENRFLRVEGVGNACSDNVTSFTTAIDRGKLKHISQEALDFFVVLFDFLMSLEGDDGSLPKEVVDDYVLKNDTIICLWDVLVGNELDDDQSLDYLMQISETCKLIVIKGIMKRHLNENLKKAYAAVSLRSRLAN